MPSPRRPRALVWTAQRVEAWQKTGERPAVAVFMAEQTAAFLSSVAQDRLAVMWWLITLRGLRHGEAAGLRWADVDLDAGVAMIEQQRIANGRSVTVGPPEDRRQPAVDRAAGTGKVNAVGMIQAVPTGSGYATSSPDG